MDGEYQDQAEDQGKTGVHSRIADVIATR